MARFLSKKRATCHPRRPLYARGLCSTCYSRQQRSLRADNCKDYALRRHHGITIEQYDVMWEQQNGKCAICGNTGEGRALCIDHDHKTGKIRGLLCVRCNTALGSFRDDINRLRNAILYLLEQGNSGVPKDLERDNWTNRFMGLLKTSGSIGDA